jgi:hypothetical protein
LRDSICNQSTGKKKTAEDGPEPRGQKVKTVAVRELSLLLLAIFFIGLLSFGFRLEKTAYRYASVTLSIIVLIPRTNPAWIVALCIDSLKFQSGLSWLSLL